MSTALQNIRAAHFELERRVNRAVRTQVGDRARLGELRNQGLALARAAEIFTEAREEQEN